MKKILNKNLLMSLGLMLSCASTVALTIEYNKSSRVEASSYSATSVPKDLNLNDTSANDIRNYYSSLNSLSASERQGTNLLKNLKPILKNGQIYHSYGSSATEAVWKAYEIVDRDWVKSPASEISGYNPSTGMVTNYQYSSGISSPGLPYVHALYVNRDVDNQTTAWGNHNQTYWGINQEHTWPKSLGFNDEGKGAGARGDLMHLWAGNGKVNGTYHGNLIYGYVDTAQSYDDAKSYASYLSGNRKGKSKTFGGSTNVFEPQDADKGDIARAMFYMAARYNYLSGSDSDGIDAGNPNLEILNSLVDSTSSYTSSTTRTGKMGILQDLLEWNRLDPPDEWEIHRNNLCYNNFTNNRNPFIDFPEWAEYIWGISTNGSYNSASTGYANPSSDNINTFDNGGTTPKVNSVSVSPASLNLNLNGTTTGNLTATVSVSNGASKTVTWSSSDANVATVSSSGVVTAHAIGTCTIIATSTFDGTKYGTAEISVTNSTISIIEDDFTFDLTTASYDNDVDEELVTWSDSRFIIKNERNGSSNTKVNNYLGGDSDNRTSSRFYKNNRLTIIPSTNYEITSVVFNATSTNYAGALNSSVWTNASSSFSGSVVTVVPDDGEEQIVGIVGGTCGFTSIVITYKYHSSQPVVTLSGISINTDQVDKTFTVGDTFNYDNLVVTADYSNNTHTVINSGYTVTSPDMSKSGNKTITVSYQGKSANYEITVNNPVVSSITATVTDVYHPGDFIEACDIYVEDNLGNEIIDFDFEDDGYMFTYNDAPSGGGEATKVFLQSLSYNNMSCDVEVHVSRNEYQNASVATDLLNKSTTGITGTSYGNWSGKTLSNGVTYAGQSAAGNESIQLRSNADNNTKEHAGIISTANMNSLSLSSVSVSWNSNTFDNREIEIYGDTTPYSSPNQLFDNIKGTYLGSIIKGTSTSLSIAGSYQYIGIKSKSDALYLESVTISYGSENTAENVANYIMYTDTEGQCTSKLPNARDYFNALSKEEKITFMTDEDNYVISSARERLIAWAAYEGKEITIDGDGVYSISEAKRSNPIFNGQLNVEDNTVTILLIVFTLGTSALSVFYLVKKKKENK